MIVSYNLKYLIKSYCRTSSFSIKELAEISQIKESNLRKWLTPNFIPEVIDVVKFSKNVKIPPILIWEAYFNSVLLWQNEDPSIHLLNYNEYSAMINFNKTKRKKFQHNSSPWEEMNEVFGKGLLNPLSLGDLLEIEPSKKYSLMFKAERLKQIEKGSIPSIKELKKIINHNDRISSSSKINGFFVQIIRMYKLNFILKSKASKAYLNLLDKVIK